jgi:organic hydroperoxide reductase OsmC/OhrA
MNDETNQKKTKHQAAPESMIDETISDSFPASDPPAWTTGTFYDEYARDDADHESELRQETYLVWQRTSDDFAYEHYNRDAMLTCGSGVSIRVSNPVKYYGSGNLINPEELLIAAVSACFMQTFLAICSKKGYIVDAYHDHASGLLGLNDAHKMAIKEIQLTINLSFSSNKPDSMILDDIKQKAHANCFIANSVACPIFVNLVQNP